MAAQTQSAAPTPGSSASNPLVIYVASQPTPMKIPLPPGASASQPMVVQVASVPTAGTPDPHWTGYVQALATPAVALIAGWIAIKQYRTAKAKVNFDLFERRLAIYEAAKALANAIAVPMPVKLADLIRWDGEMGGARWLLNENVEKHLKGLVDEGRKRLTLQELKFDGSDGEKMSEAVALMSEAFKEQNRRRKALDELFDSFMNIRH